MDYWCKSAGIQLENRALNKPRGQIYHAGIWEYMDTVAKKKNNLCGVGTSRGWIIEDGHKGSGNEYQMEEERRRSWNINI